MATLHLFFFLFTFIFLCNPHKISSACTLDFSHFPYAPHGECFDIAAGSFPVLSVQSCCHSALQSLFQAMAITANRSRPIFIEPAQAQDCSTAFQNLHNKTNLSNCQLQNFISSSTNSCSKDVDSLINVLGIERYNALQSNCKDLSTGNYKITRKRLKYASEKEIKNLSVIVLKKTLEDESRSLFTCSDLYIFSQDEMEKANKSFDYLNLIGEGTTGKFYIGIMPSGMRATIKRVNEGIRLHDFIDEICRKAKIRHPNLVSILGYCNRGDQCLVYELCVNGDLASWLLGDRRISILTWEQPLQISIEIARGLWFLHHNPLEKMVHGDIKLTNILLNEKLEAKLSNSIISKSKSKVTSRLEAMADDVFNFGVVLLQILTGRKPKSLVEQICLN